MSDITQADLLEVQALMRTMIYSQAKMLAKESDKSAEDLFQDLMKFKERQFESLAVPSISEKQQKKSD